MGSTSYALNPNENGLLLRIAINYLMENKERKFIEYALKYMDVPKSKRQLNDNDTMWTLYHHLGVAFGILGENENAFKYFKEAITYQANSQTLAFTGQICNDLGYEKEAISFWRTAAKMGNGNAILALNTRGIDI